MNRGFQPFSAMSKTNPSFDASLPALGYFYQFRYALLLALQHEEDPALQMSIEKLDDVVFLRDSMANANSIESYQFKHHIRSAGGLSDKSTDIWKTIRIWSEHVFSKKINLDHAIFLMVTTSSSDKRHASHRLLADPAARDTAEALRLLETAGKCSKNADIQDAYCALMRLSAAQRRKLFGQTYLMEGSPDILAVRDKLEAVLRHAVRPQNRVVFVERLEGWWFGLVVEHLMSAAQSQTIAVGAVHQRVHDLREQFQRDALPDDFLEAPVPTEVVQNDDRRTFIRQLRLVRVADNRIRTAQEDHYRAFAQRSRWIRDNLVDLAEVGKFEGRLLDEWRHKSEIVCEGISVDTDEKQLVAAGKSVYDWTQEHAPANAALFIRPQFPASYMVRGSYHMLADKLRVGWHPHYHARLSNDGMEGDRRC